MDVNGPDSAFQKTNMKPASYIQTVFRGLFAKNGSAPESGKAAKRIDETLEACVAVLAVFAWLAAMILLP